MAKGHGIIVNLTKLSKRVYYVQGNFDTWFDFIDR